MQLWQLCHGVFIHFLNSCEVLIYRNLSLYSIPIIIESTASSCSRSQRGRAKRSTMEAAQEVVVKGSKCQDCGNQAKKDCEYSRCRSCCKNKGFNCQTHIRSTWIPVDRRRHQKLEQQQPLQGDDTPKRHKHNPYSSSTVHFSTKPKLQP